MLGPLNPWRRDDDYRIGILRFRPPRTSATGPPGLVRTRLGQLDTEAIGGSLALLGRTESMQPVATQGPA